MKRKERLKLVREVWEIGEEDINTAAEHYTGAIGQADRVWEVGSIVEKTLIQEARAFGVLKTEPGPTEGDKGFLGRIEIDGQEIYFAITSGYSDWYPERPDWWEEVE